MRPRFKAREMLETSDRFSAISSIAIWDPDRKFYEVQSPRETIKKPRIGLASKRNGSARASRLKGFIRCCLRFEVELFTIIIITITMSSSKEERKQGR